MVTNLQLTNHLDLSTLKRGWDRKKRIVLLIEDPKQPPGMHKTLIFNGIYYLSTGAGFLPSTVCLDCLPSTDSSVTSCVCLEQGVTPKPK